MRDTLLSLEEISTFWVARMWDTYGIAKAQDTKTKRILNEPCTEHPIKSTGTFPSVRFEGKPFYEHRYLCPDCRKELEL